MRKKRTLAHVANSSGELSDRADFCIADPFRQSFLLTSLHAPPKKWIFGHAPFENGFCIAFRTSWGNAIELIILHPNLSRIGLGFAHRTWRWRGTFPRKYFIQKFFVDVVVVVLLCLWLLPYLVFIVCLCSSSLFVDVLCLIHDIPNKVVHLVQIRQLIQNEEILSPYLERHSSQIRKS